MTEGGWAVCVNPLTMLRFLREAHKASDRKCLLLAVACARRSWDSLSPQEREGFEVAERYVEGEATWHDLSEVSLPRMGNARKPETRLRQFVDATLARASEKSARAAYSQLLEVDRGFAERQRVAASLGLSDGAARDPRDGWIEANNRECLAQEMMIRDLFGNPFRPVIVEPTWLTSEVVERARLIYDGRVFDRLPALGEALTTAGCRDADLLGHCRSDALHIRGCWAVDAVLQKM